MKVQHRLEAWAARTALRILGALPPVWASNLLGAITRTIGPLLPLSKVADDNLRRAVPELDEAARRRIVRGVWDNLGRNAAEMPHLARLQPASAGPGWEVAGLEVIQALAAQGGPAILFGGHLGNWEIMPVAIARYGVPVASFYRAPDNPLIDRLIVELRRQAAGEGVLNFAKGASGARQALAHLKAKGVLGFLADQKMNDGIEARFFGRPAMTAPALAVLALRLRCPVIPTHVERLGPARFRLVFDPALQLPDSGDRTADVATLTQTVNDTLEAWIRERPEGWLWLHKRWPRD